MDPKKTTIGGTPPHIRLVATDMDGTLLDSQKRLPPDFIPWVKNHPDIKTVIACGRQYFTLEKDFRPIRDSLIFVCENGGLVYEKEKVLYRNIMSKPDIQSCLELIKHVPFATPILCGETGAYVVPGENSQELLLNAKMYYERLTCVDDLAPLVDEQDFVKIAIFFSGQHAEEEYPRFKAVNPEIASFLSGDSWVDLQNKTVNKGIAIQAIQKQYGIPPEECMAFGDFLNDYQMLQACGESYCMKNGHDDLKKIAKYITPYTNDENGVMRILEGEIK